VSAGANFGSLVAAISGLDALVFTGGIGEHAAVTRQQVCLHARWLGGELDAEAMSPVTP
jgi:acetate kinase